ncbi:methylation-associated defense system protein MAD7 [Nocardia asiatica]|uniref:methylation-associated defense system protein MAD7 n=1 Tax=Nocardia asiatica TaxID=209252 RepID=UPI003EDED310
MVLAKSDREFRHPGVTTIDYKTLDMDRVLTAFLARLWHYGKSSVILRTSDLSIDAYTDTITEHPELFSEFDPGASRRWLETHLLDLVNRGNVTQAVAGLRPLHGFTYRLRNARRSRSYGADEQLYSMLRADQGPGTGVLQYLREFFFTGLDAVTGKAESDGQVDVDTQALINLTTAVKDSITDRASSDVPVFHPPLYAEASTLLAEDTLRLLFHKELIPRSVLVEYLKILFAFHLAMYHLRCAKLLPALVAGEPAPRTAGFFLDVAAVSGTPAAALAERSAAGWYGRFPEFIRATFVVRKLDDFAHSLVKRKKISRPTDGVFRVPELLAFLGKDFAHEREQFAGARISRILDSIPPGEDDPTEQIREFGLDDFTTYIEMITTYRVRFHLGYLRECVDSLLLKNRPGAMITQPKQGQRRFILDSRLLEVLLQIALLGSDGHGGFRTVPLRVDEFLDILRERYGLYIDRLPDGDGFGEATIAEQTALRSNTRAFVDRLREIGFYSDLSDAYVTQTITPRYVVGATPEPGQQ